MTGNITFLGYGLAAIGPADQMPSLRSTPSEPSAPDAASAS